jgi:iron(III) transport system ATP-binding protein
VYNHSATKFVANFIGDINSLEPGITEQMGLPADRHHFIRLERVRVNAPRQNGEFQTRGVIENREYYGLYIKYYIKAAGQTVKVIEKNDGINIYEPGDSVAMGIHPRDVMSY